MKTFHCDKCDGPLFFENVTCNRCSRTVGFFPDLGSMGTLEGKRYRACQNYTVQNVCNWVIPATEPDAFCLSCRLTSVIPDLTQPGNKEAWYRVEVAKRRLVYTLLDLGLPVVSKAIDPARGLAFEFKADQPSPESGPVLTGHDEGLVTLNIAEADDPERERRRIQMNEPYRTLLGHLRHEIGHYYWNLLIRDTDWLDEYRRLFGDERADYEQALQRYYDDGPPADWQQTFVSRYAASHPWEDWAETWAHYLHMIDSLDTAAACGVALHPLHSREPSIAHIDPVLGKERFATLVKNWFALTYALNNLNRSMGLHDPYPFVVPGQVLLKLRFVHEVVTHQGQRHEDEKVAASAASHKTLQGCPTAVSAALP